MKVSIIAEGSTKGQEYIMKAADIFTPTKSPTVTLVDEHLQDKQLTLTNALETGGLVISLSGPSKSGKTVFIENCVGKEKLLQITGAGIINAHTLWDRVFDMIGTPVDVRTGTEKSTSGTFGGKLKAEAGFFVSAEGELNAAGTWGTKNSTAETYSTDYLQLLIRELNGTGLVVFIDDFHYIPKEVQAEVANQIKEAIRNDVTIICASVPYHSDDVLRANADLRGRITTIDFDYWKPDVLQKIAIKGFDALKVCFPAEYIQTLASEAAGSPQLMQALCLHTCFQSNIRETCNSLEDHQPSGEILKRICSQTALMTDYSSTVEKMKEGPRVRGTDRIQYKLRDGSISDVYPIILKAIATDPPELTIRYPNLQNRIIALCDGQAPSGSSITGACYQMSLLANDSEARSVVEWDGENDVIDIRDPYLLFYLRWAEFPSS